MTTKRLEELAAKCAVAIDGVGRNASYGLSDSDLADLARCARAWAKLERMIDGQDGYSLDFWYWKEKTRLVTNSYSGRGPTAIEAVEAAEVGK